MSIGENDGAKAPLLNVANVLTVLRLILVPVFVAVYWSDTPVRSALAWFVFALAAATDKADGYLARSRGLITDFGKMADSLADKALVSAALIGAAVMPAADWLGRQIMFPYEVPAGMTATLLGGAYFMFMMRRM